MRNDEDNGRGGRGQRNEPLAVRAGLISQLGSGTRPGKIEYAYVDLRGRGSAARSGASEKVNPRVIVHLGFSRGIERIEHSYNSLSVSPSASRDGKKLSETLQFADGQWDFVAVGCPSLVGECR